MRPVRCLVAAAAVLLVAAPVAPGQMLAAGAQVSIGFSDYAPAQVDVLAGETVDWSNDSVRQHTITDDAGGFDSGTVAPNAHYAHLFSEPGAFSYHCRLHPYIRGQVDVYRLLLSKPTAAASSGVTYPLHGRAALDAATPVTVEFDDGSGAGWRSIAQTTVAPDGSFDARVTPSTSGSYRAVAQGESSPPVALLVLNRSVSASARSGRTRTRVSALVTPASPGTTVVLQLYLKEHFGWWPVAQGKLDKHSRATFTIPLRRRVSARVVLTLPDGATRLATSATLRLGPG